MTPQIKKPDWLGFDPETRHVSIDPRTPAFVQDPYAAYAFLHRHAPVFFWKEYGMWCVAGHDLANRIFRDRRFGRERPGGYLASVGAEGPRPHLADFDRVEASSMLEIEPPVHTRLRTLVNRAFVSRQVERLRPRIEALCHRLIDGFEADRDAELIAAYATPVPATVIAEMMGVPVETGPQLTAKQALDRVVIPAEALTRIRDMVGPGSSITISDHGISHETGKGTDFVVLTR